MRLASFARRLIVAAAYGGIIGATLAVLFYGIGTFVNALSPSAISAPLMAGFGFALGFGGSVTVTLAEDLPDDSAAAPRG